LHDIPGLRNQRERSDEEEQQPYCEGPGGYGGNAGLEYVVESEFHVLAPWLFGFTILALIYGVVAGGDVICLARKSLPFALFKAKTVPAVDRINNNEIKQIDSGKTGRDAGL
jgi:hypothetical protein